MSKKIALLFLFLTYALVLVHGVMPHEHLHEKTVAAKQHSHDSHNSQAHSHAHEDERNAASDSESPLSHYFHSLAQGEPHFSGKENVLISEASSEAAVAVQIFHFSYRTYHTVRSSAVYEADFHSPPDAHHFSRRGPPLT